MDDHIMSLAQREFFFLKLLSPDKNYKVDKWVLKLLLYRNVTTVFSGLFTVFMLARKNSNALITFIWAERRDTGSSVCVCVCGQYWCWIIMTSHLLGDLHPLPFKKSSWCSDTPTHTDSTLVRFLHGALIDSYLYRTNMFSTSMDLNICYFMYLQLLCQTSL